MNATPNLRRSESTCMRVLEAVADVRDVDVGNLNPPLGTVIDPDALEAVLDADPASDVAVTFTYADCRITVTGDALDVRPCGEGD